MSSTPYQTVRLVTNANAVARTGSVSGDDNSLTSAGARPRIGRRRTTQVTASSTARTSSTTTDNDSTHAATSATNSTGAAIAPSRPAPRRVTSALNRYSVALKRGSDEVPRVSNWVPPPLVRWPKNMPAPASDEELSGDEERDERKAGSEQGQDEANDEDASNSLEVPEERFPCALQGHGDQELYDLHRPSQNQGDSSDDGTTSDEGKAPAKEKDGSADENSGPEFPPGLATLSRTNSSGAPQLQRPTFPANRVGSSTSTERANAGGRAPTRSWYSALP